MCLQYEHGGLTWINGSIQAIGRFTYSLVMFADNTCLKLATRDLCKCGVYSRFLASPSFANGIMNWQV